MLADHLQKSLARPVIVENRPGAGGRIALRAVKEAAPDGATLLFATAGLFTLYPHVYANLGYNPLVDLLPIIQVVKFDQALAVSGKLPVRSLPELVAWLWAPAGTPSTVAERLRAAIADALNNGEIRTRIETLGFEIAGTTGEALVQILRAEHDRWGPIVKASGFKADQ
jgi:tripartite-type tricarboxylate transporter receptor subunit TctC